MDIIWVICYLDYCEFSKGSVKTWCFLKYIFHFHLRTENTTNWFLAKNFLGYFLNMSTYMLWYEMRQLSCTEIQMTKCKWADLVICQILKYCLSWIFTSLRWRCKKVFFIELQNPFTPENNLSTCQQFHRHHLKANWYWNI